MPGYSSHLARLRATLIAVASLALAGTASASVVPARPGPVAASDPAGPASPLVTIWDQTGTTDPSGFTPSSNYDADQDPFDSIAADDFEIANTGTVWDLTQVTAVGGYDGSGSSVVDSVLVQIYADDTHARPGLLLHSQTVPGHLVIGQDTVVFALNLEPQLKLGSGRYWLAVQANKEFSSSLRQWVWRESTALRLNPSVWRQPGNGLGRNCITFLPRIAVCQQPTFSTNPDLSFKIDANTSTENPVPYLIYLSPASKTPGSPDFTLTLNGVNFVNGAIAVWNGVEQPTTVVSGNRLTATIDAALVSSMGTATVLVRNPPPAGGDSNTVVFFVAGQLYLPVINR